MYHFLKLHLDSFERVFLHNCSAFFLVFGQMPDKKMLKTILKECVDFSNEEIKEIINTANQLSDYPYIYLSNRYLKNHLESKVRFNLFTDNLILIKRFSWLINNWLMLLFLGNLVICLINYVTKRFKKFIKNKFPVISDKELRLVVKSNKSEFFLITDEHLTLFRYSG